MAKMVGPFKKNQNLNGAVRPKSRNVYLEQIMFNSNTRCFVFCVLPNKYLHRQRNEGNNINKLFVFVDAFLKGQNIKRVGTYVTVLSR